MMTHFFTEFIDAVAKTLGLNYPTHSTEKASKDTNKDLPSDDPTKPNEYDYLPKINNIRERLHAGSSLPPNILSNHIDILEHVCSALISKEIILQESICDTYIIYIKNALIPLICADILIFKEQANEESIYYHLDRILRTDNVVTQDGEQRVFRKRSAYKYMLDYIGNCFSPDMGASRSAGLRVADNFIHELLIYLDELPKNKGNQTSRSLNRIINACTERLSPDDLIKYSFIINSIFSAYTAVIILQDINNKTGMFDHFLNTYIQLAHGTNHLLNHLNNALECALRFDYNAFNEEDEILSATLECPPLLLVKEKQIERIDNIINCITPLFGEQLTYTGKKSLVWLNWKSN